MSTITQNPVRRYDMFTKAGDSACESLVKKIEKKIAGKFKVTGEEVLAMIEEGMDKIALKHGEVHDTEPRVEIAHQVSKALQRAGYGFYIGSFLNVEQGDYSIWN